MNSLLATRWDRNVVGYMRSEKDSVIRFIGERLLEFCFCIFVFVYVFGLGVILFVRFVGFSFLVFRSEAALFAGSSSTSRDLL